MNRTADLPLVTTREPVTEARVTFRSRTDPLAGMDQLIRERTADLVSLIADRRSLADVLFPGRTPLDEPEEEQLSHAAFSLAAAAMEIAIGNSPDPASTLRGFRSAVALHAAEVGVR
ncbi:hypothetical protein OG978_32605 [Streptomyces sp. NBC_01591]|uniref:hypothetical protein n=1 Tax=Streptomyces sp. NBC_01591 TaxID=2975888 RepID=UPI002DDA0E98|nr:hypothetical protein [Streptomyces sp. NBC_01591]WSD71715.1 hypothetical protein OG978_32605 [Streptomyces sp. NBC_01591]